MLHLIRIYGERNSGTNFLHQLMKNNFDTTNYMRNSCDKHYSPQDDKRLTTHEEDILKNQENKTIVKIFIFRKLEHWLVSMFHNPYCIHFTCNHTFTNFLNEPLSIKNKQHISPIRYNSYDEGHTIFEVRYHKYQRIKEYCEQNENVVLVSLEYLQNDDNCIHFLKELNTRYNFNKKEDEFKLVEKHTKNRNIPLKNRTYKINHEDYQSEIDKHKNIEIENEINNLTYFIK